MGSFGTGIRATPVVLLCLAGARAAHAADPIEVGPEIVITTADYMDTPRVASDPAGNFLVVWQDTNESQVEAQGFYATGNAQGPIFQMSAPDLYVTAGSFDSDELLSVASDAAGNFVVAFNAYDTDAAYQGPCYGSACVLTRRRDANGVLAPATFIVGDPRLNAYSGAYYNQTANPELAADGEGNFVVAWEGYDSTSAGSVTEGVWARKLVNSGQVNGGQFLVNAVKNGYQGDTGRLDLAADDAGNFTVVWHDENDDYPPYSGVSIRRFDKFKNPIGSQQNVTPDSANDVAVASTGAGASMVVWGDGPIRGRVYDSLGAAVGAEFQVAATGSYPEVSAAGPSAFVVVFDGPAGLAGRLFDTAGSAVSNEFAISPTGYTPSVAADGVGNFVVTWKEDDYEARAQRFQVEAPQPADHPLLGKVLVVTNKIPDDFAKSSGKWKAGGSVVVPQRGSASDPRCNGDPAGTVKATARFSSATSGEDTGPIPLPCEGWTATGSNVVSAVLERGFKYSDSGAVHGPCSSITITGTKSLSVTCKGKTGFAVFSYDLMVGAGQGAMIASLTLGDFTYCAEFQPLLDGSDGKQFKGKALAVPIACP